MTRFLQTALATILTLVIGAAYGLVVHRPMPQQAVVYDEPEVIEAELLPWPKGGREHE